MSVATYVVKNKFVETDENFKNLVFTIADGLYECWLSGKYLAKVCITHTPSNSQIVKEYFCSITKKEKNINYIYLNHIEPEEILQELKLVHN